MIYFRFCWLILTLLSSLDDGKQEIWILYHFDDWSSFVVILISFRPFTVTLIVSLEFLATTVGNPGLVFSSEATTRTSPLNLVILQLNLTIWQFNIIVATGQLLIWPDFIRWTPTLILVYHLIRFNGYFWNMNISEINIGIFDP